MTPTKHLVPLTTSQIDVLKELLSNRITSHQGPYYVSATSYEHTPEYGLLLNTLEVLHKIIL